MRQPRQDRPARRVGKRCQRRAQAVGRHSYLTHRLITLRFNTRAIAFASSVKFWLSVPLLGFIAVPACAARIARPIPIARTQLAVVEGELPMAPRLNIIIGSTRPGRVGPSMASWFDGFAREHGAFEPVLVDLADFDLPVYDEPNHPRLRQYVHEHTKRVERQRRRGRRLRVRHAGVQLLRAAGAGERARLCAPRMGLQAGRHRQLRRRFRRHALGADAEAAAHQPEGHADPRQRQCRRLSASSSARTAFSRRTNC